MTRGIAPDLADRRFGRLHVLRRTASDAHNNAQWICKCDCGNEVPVRAAFLRRGQQYCSKQCPFYSESLRCDISQRRFGRVTAIAFVRFSHVGKAIWSFQCDCGGTVERHADQALNGNLQSCGCLGIESRIKHGQSQTREYHRQAHREWSERNPAKVIANANKRRADYRQRIPAWLTDDDWEQINSYYLEAKRLKLETGISHAVDHVIPLRGKKVSGLHVPWNLQVLTEQENLRKSARLSDEVC